MVQKFTITWSRTSAQSTLIGKTEQKCPRPHKFIKTDRPGAYNVQITDIETFFVVGGPRTENKTRATDRVSAYHPFSQRNQTAIMASQVGRECVFVAALRLGRTLDFLEEFL